MTIKEIIKHLKTHKDQNRPLEIILMQDGDEVFKEVEIDFQMDGDIYLQVKE